MVSQDHSAIFTRYPSRMSMLQQPSTKYQKRKESITLLPPQKKPGKTHGLALMSLYAPIPKNLLSNSSTVKQYEPKSGVLRPPAGTVRRGKWICCCGQCAENGQVELAGGGAGRRRRWSFANSTCHERGVYAPSLLSAKRGERYWCTVYSARLAEVRSGIGPLFASFVEKPGLMEAWKITEREMTGWDEWCFRQKGWEKREEENADRCPQCIIKCSFRFSCLLGVWTGT